MPKTTKWRTSIEEPLSLTTYISDYDFLVVIKKNGTKEQAIISHIENRCEGYSNYLKRIPVFTWKVFHLSQTFGFGNGSRKKIVSLYTKPLSGGPQEIILKYHREDKIQCRICQELKIGRKTVCRYLVVYESMFKADNSPDAPSVGSYLSSASVYKSENRSKRRLTPEIQEAIDVLLLVNQQNEEARLGKQLF